MTTLPPTESSWTGVARLGRAAGALLACALLSLLLAQAAPAAETPTHAFDATLSLTGDCSTSALDPIADPGLCPMPPGVAGLDHPSARFSWVTSETTDEYGNLYVVSGYSNTEAAQARVDVFDSSGHFLTEVPDPRAKSVAVDSEGHLYVISSSTPEAEARVLRFDPTPPYNPAVGEIEYADPPVLALSEAKNSLSFERRSIAVDGAGHLYLSPGFGGPIREYGSAAEGNASIDEHIGEGVLHISPWMAIDRSQGELYASDTRGAVFTEPSVIRVFDLKEPGDPLVRTIDGSTAPPEEFSTEAGLASVAVDESTHHVFVDDRGASTAKKPVYEFTETGSYVATLENHFEFVSISQIAIDNGAHSPNSGFAPGRKAGYLFVPSGPSQTNSHLYAFQPLTVGPPGVEALSVEGVSATEALLRAKVNPDGDPTHYTFEYTTQANFEAEGFAGATLAGEGDLPLGIEALEVSAPVSGLAPGTAYRFRVTAANSFGTDGGEHRFATYPEATGRFSCPNEAMRVGLAKDLPDCRAYELVSPGDTNGLSPIAVGAGTGAAFSVPSASPDGEGVGFLTIGGSLPGIGGSGSAQGDGYVARRAASGWQITLEGPSGPQSGEDQPAGVSPDQEFAAWRASNGGTLASPPGSTYIRYPDGSFQPVGRGSLGVDHFSQPELITAGATHIIFGPSTEPTRTPVQLEPDAPPSGTAAIYDRTPDELTHVVSLLPGDVTPAAGEGATFQGASPDGQGVAFTIGAVLYERLGDAQTFAVASGASFAGISETGARVFYLKGGNLFAFDEGTTTQLTTTGDVTPVNISSDGSHAYFVSPSVIHPGEENAEGEDAQAGGENLYLWAGGTITYIATLTERDVIGEKDEGSGAKNDGLGLWLEALQFGGAMAMDPSRAVPDGSTFVFTSRADLTAYEAEGKEEVYRYQAGSGELRCISCLPTRLPPSADSNLESVGTGGNGSPAGRFTLIPNLSPDGQRVFFQSSDALVPSDVNGLQDVYQWEAQGKGSCTSPGGCVSLISSGQGARPSFIYGASNTGDDVFFASPQQLLASDTEETPSIYDARVGGGFPSSSALEECLGEACQPAAVALNDLIPASLAFNGSGNLVPQPAATTKAKAKPTNAQKLAKALKACKQKRKSQRKRCNDQARKRYGKPAKRSSRARHASSHQRTAK